MTKPRVMIGIPCYQNAPAETLEDYMRFMFYLGRRATEYEFVLGIKDKSEQFRARNSICEQAISTGCDYLFFLDDDQVIDWEKESGPSQRYGFLQTMIKAMEEDKTIGILGGLYFQRSGEGRPVAMMDHPNGGYAFMKDEDLTGGMQDVAVTGGGCMLIKRELLLKVRQPWFEPEQSTGGENLGTDVQICKKAREAGYRVVLDSSIELGHVKNTRTIVTSRNKGSMASLHQEGMDEERRVAQALELYANDAAEYAQCTREELQGMAVRYNQIDMPRILGVADKREHYRNLSIAQLGRQVWFHTEPQMVQQAKDIWKMFDPRRKVTGVDVGCGSAPVGFELVMQGHTMDFIDVDGAPAYEFTKWRATRRGMEKRCGFKMGEHGPYDFALCLDSIEHIEDWQSVLNDINANLSTGGVLITNYFHNQDYNNPEHISMDKDAVKAHLVDIGLYPVHGTSQWVWCKQKEAMTA